jgi:electron transfer flavoprotein beta subunit
MKILVCISNVPDTTTKIAFSADNSTFNAAGVQFVINPYDEWYALVRALELKEAQGGNVTILHVGAADSEATIRKGLAIGADDAVRIDAEPNDAFAVAEQIAAFAKDKGFDLGVYCACIVFLDVVKYPIIDCVLLLFIRIFQYCFLRI